jgi:predicted enzyme related to lactoylglutathione lyase
MTTQSVGTSLGPRMRFLSLFVPDLDTAVAQYTAVFGVEPREGPGAALSPHPFSGRGPVVFDLGQVCLALYQCDGRTTHPGDVGIGVEVEDPAVTTGAVRASGGQVFFGPRTVAGDGREMAIFVLPDQHFFEVVKGEGKGEEKEA